MGNQETQASEFIQRNIARFRVLLELGFTAQQIAETLNLSDPQAPKQVG